MIEFIGKCRGQGTFKITPGPYFIKVKIILSLKFKINLIFYLIKEFVKHSFLNFFYEIDDHFILNPDFKKILTFMK